MMVKDDTAGVNGCGTVGPLHKGRASEWGDEGAEEGRLAGRRDVVGLDDEMGPHATRASL